MSKQIYFKKQPYQRQHKPLPNYIKLKPATSLIINNPYELNSFYQSIQKKNDESLIQKKKEVEKIKEKLKLVKERILTNQLTKVNSTQSIINSKDEKINKQNQIQENPFLFHKIQEGLNPSLVKKSINEQLNHLKGHKRFKESNKTEKKVKKN